VRARTVTSLVGTALLAERGEVVERILVVILCEVRRVELLLGDRRLLVRVEVMMRKGFAVGGSERLFPKKARERSELRLTRVGI
jgi:hypothetical protein